MKNIYLFSVLILSVASYAEAKKACELQKGVEPVKQQLHPQNEEVFCPIINFENTFSYGQQKTGKSEWLLDSVNTYSFSSESDSIDYTKRFYIYDENSKLTQVLGFLNYGQWGGTINWRYWSKDEMEYDKNGKLILETSYSYDIENEVWVYSRKNVSEYDEYENRTLAKRYSWDEETGRWVGQSKLQYGYTSQGERTFMISHIWHHQSENWKPDWKREYAYNEEGYPVVDTHYDWDNENEEWVYTGKTENEYDDSWNLIFAFGYDWDMDNEVYIPRFKAEREHNDDNNVVMHTVYNWDQDNNTWVGFWKNELDYDTQGNMILIMQFEWSIETGEWLELRVWEWEYDADGNMVSQIWGVRDNNLEQLVYSRKEEYVYNEEGYQALTIVYDWSTQSNDWRLEFKQFFHYSEILVSAAPFTEGVQIVLYPNPVREFINIEGMRKPDINIFDLSGTLILSRSNETTIDVSGLPAGVYLIKVTDDQNSKIKRFVKQ